MPSLNVRKPYVRQGIYHIYNRAVDKKPLFVDKQDYAVFICILETYLCKPKQNLKQNYFKVIYLMAYCLMPNHFHFMLKQANDERAIAKFMKSLTLSYSLYFNRKYKRTGTLFENRYRGVLVEKDSYLLHLSRYIHLNPRKVNTDPLSYEYSSIKDYLGFRKTAWINTDLITEYFDFKNREGNFGLSSYKHFLRSEL